MKKFVSYCVITVFALLLLSSTDGFANGALPTPGTPPVGLPIDGGLAFLLLSGLFLGVTTLFKRK